MFHLINQVISWVIQLMHRPNTSNATATTLCQKSMPDERSFTRQPFVVTTSGQTSPVRLEIDANYSKMSLMELESRGMFHFIVSGTMADLLGEVL